MESEAILVTGASGVLGWSLCRSLASSGSVVVGTYRVNRPDIPGCEVVKLPLEDPDMIYEFTSSREFSAIVHCGAITNPDQCEKNPELAQAVNVSATQAFLRGSDSCPFLFTSTDLVFDGSKGLYSEEDAPSPLNLYGKTKVQAEEIILQESSGIVLRIAKLFSNGSPYHKCFTNWMKERFESGIEVPLFSDQYRSPVFVGDVVRAIRRLINTRPRRRLYHLGGPDRLSRLEFGCAFAGFFGYDERLIKSTRSGLAGLVERGHDCSLDSSLFCNEFEFLRTPLSNALRQLREQMET